MARCPSEAILSFGLADDFFSQYPKFGPPIGFSVLAVQAIIPTSLRHLMIYLGRDIRPAHDRAFNAILKRTTSHCPNLESVSIIAYAESWTDLVRQWKSGTVVLYKEHVIDTARGYDVLTCWRKFGTEWGPTSSATFPLDRVSECAENVCKLPQLEELTLLPSTDRSTFPYNRGAILQGFSRLLTGLPKLYKVSLPIDSPDVIPILKSSLPHPFTLVLSTYPAMCVTPTLLTALVANFSQFHLLRELCIPGHALCDPLRDCLGDLQDLQEQTIIVTGLVPAGALMSHARDKFPVLRTLNLLGSTAFLSDIAAILRAFAFPGVSAIKKVKIEAGSLSGNTEMKDTLRIITQHCPRLEKLNICINGVNAAEESDWMDLTLLRTLNLKVFLIKHPRPLPLTDNDVGVLLRAWRSAEFLSFNPRPTSPPGYSEFDEIPQLPTLNCLTSVAKEGRSLHHFGIYLNPLPPYYSNDRHSLLSLRELDLGASVVDRGFWVRLFPNAKRL